MPRSPAESLLVVPQGFPATPRGWSTWYRSTGVVRQSKTIACHRGRRTEDPSQVGGRNRKQAGWGFIINSRPTGISTQFPHRESRLAGEGEHPSPPRKRRRRPSTSPSRPPSLRSPKHRVCVVTTQGSDAWSSRRSVPMVGSATFPTADRTPSRVGAQVGDGCRGAVAGRGAHCYGKACSPGSSLVRLGSRAWPRLTCSRPDAPRPMSEVASPASPASSQRSVLDLATAARHPVSAVLQELGSTQTGLTSEEAAGRLASVGRNVLASHKVTALGVLGRQLRNPLLILLLAAAAVSAATGDPTDGAIIAAIVGLSVGLGFVNEYRSELAVAALHAGIRHQALVWRDGSQQRLDVRDLVPGDVVALRVGDLVPADLRLLEADQLECDEAVLTGEPIPAVKTADPVPASDSTVDLPSCAFMGTVVHQGAGRGVVVATGSATAFGKIAAGLAERQAETGFQAGLRGFSKLLVKIAAVLTTSIFVINLALHRPLLDTLLFSLAIAIGITPQLLPAVVSVSLSTGSRQLARRRVLVKRLVTIEDLGNIEVLFTDKTGTLTQGAITFDQALDPAGQPARWPLLLGLVCNEATITEHGPVGGNALDVALWSAPAAQPLAADATGGPRAYQRLGLAPFDHDRQLASVAVRTPPAVPRCWSPRAHPRPSWPAAPRSQPTRRRPWRGCSPTAPASSPSPPARRPGSPPRARPTSTACTWPASSPSSTAPKPTPAPRSPSSAPSA